MCDNGSFAISDMHRYIPAIIQYGKGRVKEFILYIQNHAVAVSTSTSIQGNITVCDSSPGYTCETPEEF